jgi:hypothetical protein
VKRTIRDNYRVEITPDTWLLSRTIGQDHEAMQRLLVDIKRAVERHIDGVDQVIVRWDTQAECSHCETAWEVLTAADAATANLLPDRHSVEGEPVCCEAAINEFRKERGIPPLDLSGPEVTA